MSNIDNQDIMKICHDCLLFFDQYFMYLLIRSVNLSLTNNWLRTSDQFCLGAPFHFLSN